MRRISEHETAGIMTRHEGKDCFSLVATLSSVNEDENGVLMTFEQGRALARHLMKFCGERGNKESLLKGLEEAGKKIINNTVREEAVPEGEQSKEIINRIFDRRPETLEEIMKAFQEGRITSAEDLKKQLRVHAIEYAIQKWKAKGEPDLWIFNIDDDLFVFLKNPDGMCQLLMFDKKKMDVATNPPKGYKIRDGCIVPEWGL